MASSRLRLDVDDGFIKQYAQMHERDLVFHALDTLEFPVSSRRNVRRAGDSKPVYGMCLGMTSNWQGWSMPSRATRERPNLAKLLNAFVKHEVPDFEFTSIQVNKDYAAALHVDKNNAGTSMIIGLGNYTGGQLWINECDRLGRVVDLHNRWFQFDGNNAHAVLPFRGRRYTLVYFTRAASHGGRVGEEPDSAVARQLSNLGFALPRECPKELWYPPAELRVQQARNKLEDFCIHTLRRGGPGRVRLRLRFSDGQITQACVVSIAPLSSLMEGVLQHFGDKFSRPVQLKIGNVSLLPGDTARGLGLNSKCVIDILAGACPRLADDLRLEEDQPRTMICDETSDFTSSKYMSNAPSLKAMTCRSGIAQKRKRISQQQIDGLEKDILELEPQQPKRMMMEVAKG